MKTMQYIQTLMFTLAAASSMTKEQMMKSHETITREEPCFGLAPKDKRTRATMIAAFERQIAWMIDFDHNVALVMNSKMDAINDPRTDDEGNDQREWCGNDIEAAHAEALEMNAAMSMPVTETKFTLYCVANDFVRKSIFDGDHALALEVNALVDSELAKLCRVIAGIRRTLYRQETKQRLIGAACRTIVDGLRKRLNVAISPEMLPVITVRAAK